MFEFEYNEPYIVVNELGYLGGPLCTQPSRLSRFLVSGLAELFHQPLACHHLQFAAAFRQQSTQRLQPITTVQLILETKLDKQNQSNVTL